MRGWFTTARGLKCDNSVPTQGIFPEKHQSAHWNKNIHIYDNLKLLDLLQFNPQIVREDRNQLSLAQISPTPQEDRLASSSLRGALRVLRRRT